MNKYLNLSCREFLFPFTLLFLLNTTCHAGFSRSTRLTLTANDISTEKCYGDYGCFSNEGPWSTLVRSPALFVYPQSPEEIEPRFLFFTSKHFNQSKIINLAHPDNLTSLRINEQTKIYVISHGYLESAYKPWLSEMGKALLNQHHKHGAVVVLVDWSGGSHPPYVQAAVNTRVVGVMTAHLLFLLQKKHNLRNLDNVHLIGHSLGAHLMGYCGAYLQENFGLKVKRISGLDPAAPLFTDTDVMVRLDTSDAEFVDVIHTDVSLFMKGGLGIYQPIGHIDFYPNGGSDNPGCDKQLTEYIKNTEKSILSNMQEFLGCNHLRSHQYFTESILSNCPFMAITCPSYEEFKNVQCFNCNSDENVCIPMGFHSYQKYLELKDSERIDVNKPPMLYLTTGNREPFCRVHYKITVRVAGHDESTIHGGEIGMLSVRLHGKSSHTASDRVNFSDEVKYFEPGCEYSALVPGKDISKPRYASVHWEYQTNILNPLTWRILKSPRIFIEYILIESLEYEELFLKLCSLNNSPVVADSENVFKAQYCKESL